MMNFGVATRSCVYKRVYKGVYKRVYKRFFIRVYTHVYKLEHKRLLTCMKHMDVTLDSDEAMQSC